MTRIEQAYLDGFIKAAVSPEDRIKSFEQLAGIFKLINKEEGNVPKLLTAPNKNIFHNPIADEGNPWQFDPESAWSGEGLKNSTALRRLGKVQQRNLGQTPGLWSHMKNHPFITAGTGDAVYHGAKWGEGALGTHMGTGGEHVELKDPIAGRNAYQQAHKPVDPLDFDSMLSKLKGSVINHPYMYGAAGLSAAGLSALGYHLHNRKQQPVQEQPNISDQPGGPEDLV